MKENGEYPNPLTQAYDCYIHNKVVIGLNFNENIKYVVTNYNVKHDDLIDYINERINGEQTGA